MLALRVDMTIGQTYSQLPPHFCLKAENGFVMVVIVFWCSHVDTPTGFAHPLGSTRPPTYTRPRGRSGEKFPHICTPGLFLIRVAVLCIRAAVLCFRRCTFLYDCKLTFTIPTRLHFHRVYPQVVHAGFTRPRRYKKVI